MNATTRNTVTGGTGLKNSPSPAMKSQFLALLNFNRTGVLALILWLVAGTWAALAMTGQNGLNLGTLAQDHLHSNWNGEVGCTIMLGTWLMITAIWCGAMLVPVLTTTGAPAQANALEFHFTRAISRRVLFRAWLAFWLGIWMTPFFANLLLSPFQPPSRLGPEIMDAPAMASLQQRYLQIFPGSQVEVADPTVPSHQAMIRHGTQIFCLWLFWMLVSSQVLVQLYFALISRRVSRGSWRTFLLVYSPIAAAYLATVIVCTRTQVYFFEERFLFFAAHPAPLCLALAVVAVVVQRFCERRFSELEVL